MTSPWKDGIASDLEESERWKPHSPAYHYSFTAAVRHLSGREPYVRIPQYLCDCADCRAIVALVEETIDKP